MLLNIVTALLANKLLLVAGLVSLAFFLYRRSLPERRPGEPPIVPASVPWLGSLLEFVKDPNKFVEAQRGRMGEVFTAIMGGQRFVFVCHFSCLPEVLRRTRDLSFEAYKNKSVLSGFGQGEIRAALDMAYPEIDQDLAKRMTSSDLGELCVRFHDALRSLLSLPGLEGSEKSFFSAEPNDRVGDLSWKSWPEQGKVWHKVDLLCLLRLVTATNCDVFLGPNVASKEFQDDLMSFSNLFPELTKGIPEWLPLPRLQQARAARERLYAAPCIQEHTSAVSSVLLARREIFIEQTGSGKFKTFADVGFLFGSIVNTNQAIFWVMAHLLQDKEALAAVLEEADNVLGKGATFSTEAKKMREQLSRLVKLDSVVNEVFRHHSIGFTNRVVMNDMELHFPQPIGSVRVRKGDLIMAPARATHMDKDIYGDDVEEFRWDRFLNADKTQLRRFTDRKTGSIVLHNLNTFGGGTSLCPGRHFARDEVKLTAITFLRNFEFELFMPGQKLPMPDPLPLSIELPLLGSKFWVNMRVNDQFC